MYILLVLYEMSNRKPLRGDVGHVDSVSDARVMWFRFIEFDNMCAHVEKEVESGYSIGRSLRSGVQYLTMTPIPRLTHYHHRKYVIFSL
jgi:hypothetical protein